MTSPVKLRQQILEDASALVDLYSKAARGEATFMLCVDEARKEVWDTLKHIILQADDPAPLAKLTDGDISARVDSILNGVSEGEITPEEGKRLMSLLQAGFDITELPKLIAAIEKADK